MDIKYTNAQAIALNALAEAAKKVRDEGWYVKAIADNILFQLEKSYRPSEGFGKNKLAEAVSRYNAVADIAGAVCGDLTIEEVEESFRRANAESAPRFRAAT